MSQSTCTNNMFWSSQHSACEREVEDESTYARVHESESKGERVLACKRNTIILD